MFILLLVITITISVEDEQTGLIHIWNNSVVVATKKAEECSIHCLNG